MLIKQGAWYNGSLKCKVAEQGWVNPDISYFKQSGVWVPVQGSQVLQLDLDDLIADVAEWSYDSVMGWSWDYNIKREDGVVVVTLSQQDLSSIRKVSAVFTGYHNTPLGSLGTNEIHIVLNDGSYVDIGTRVHQASSSAGQRISKGDAGKEEDALRDVLGERFTYTVPEGYTVSLIEIHSYSQLSSGGRAYAITKRGMKDFEFLMEY